MREFGIKYTIIPNYWEKVFKKHRGNRGNEYSQNTIR